MSSIIAMTGPSLAGKTTLTDALKKEGSFVIPKHITTRQARIDDEPGFYRYVDVDTFHQLVDQNQMLFYSGMVDRFYGVLKEDCEDCLSKSEYAIVHMSYKDIQQYLLMEYQKYLVTLTFRNIPVGMMQRFLFLQDRQMSWDELSTRICAAVSDHEKYFDTVAQNSDCLVYTDECSEQETYQKVLKKINK